MKTAELARRLRCTDQTLYRLVARGILSPGGERGAGGHLLWPPAERRAAAACVSLTRSHLMVNSTSTQTARTRDACLRSIAELAREPLPAVGAPRWIILFSDGSCTRGSNWLASVLLEHRTLIELEEIAAKA